jgi:hypothetical protein
MVSKDESTVPKMRRVGVCSSYQRHFWITCALGAFINGLIVANVIDRRAGLEKGWAINIEIAAAVLCIQGAILTRDWFRLKENRKILATLWKQNRAEIVAAFEAQHPDDPEAVAEMLKMMDEVNK